MDAGAEVWRQLERGSWSVVDQHERRYVLGPVHDRDALTSRERVIVEYASRGWSNKVIAYELDIATSTVSTHLSRAAAKLGVRSRGAMIQLVAGLASSTPEISYFDRAGERFAVLEVLPGVPAGLTSAERHVVALVFAGASNAAIAKARGVSKRTVENQMASVMRKLCVTSRTDLIAMLSRSVPSGAR